MTTYADFLAEKVNFESACGFDIDPDRVHPILKPHQRDIVVWAVMGGRRAIFAAFGLGKSVIARSPTPTGPPRSGMPAPACPATAPATEVPPDGLPEHG